MLSVGAPLGALIFNLRFHPLANKALNTTYTLYELLLCHEEVSSRNVQEHFMSVIKVERDTRFSLAKPLMTFT